MKSRFSSTAVWKTAALIMAVVVAVSMVGSVQAAAPQNQIVVRDQDLTTGIATFDSVTAAQNGWIVVYKDPNFSNGDIVGYAWVHAGVNTNVKVTIDAKRIYVGADRTTLQPTLWALLQVDNGVPGLFEWGLRNLPYNDAPVVENGHEVMAEFGTWASQATTSAAPAVPAPAPAQPAAMPAPAPASTTPSSNTGSIVVKDQDLTAGIATFDSVTAAQDGWIVVYKDPGFSSGDIVGYAWVHAGVNTNVKVTIDARRIDPNGGRANMVPTLWARLQVDNGVPGLFEWGLHNLPYDDAPAVVNGQTVIAEFGTWASQ